MLLDYYPLVYGLQWAAAITDEVGLTDVTAQVADYSRTYTDIEGVTDLAAQAFAGNRVVIETLGITDPTTQTYVGDRRIIEDVGITDPTTQTYVGDRRIIEALGITDTVARLAAFVRSLADTLGITDVHGLDLERTLADALGVTDTFDVTKGLIRVISDVLGITDPLSPAATYLRQQLDTIGITDPMEGSPGRGWGDRWHSWVTLELDTIPPVLHLTCTPSIRAPEEVIEIACTFTGEWGWGSMILIDGQGTIFSIGFKREGQVLTARVESYDIGSGPARLTVRVADDVGNMAEVAATIPVYREESGYGVGIGIDARAAGRVERRDAYGVDLNHGEN